MCINAGFIASDWAWLHGPVLGHRRLGLGLGDRWACPGSGGDPARRLWGRGRRSKVRPCLLMRHCTAVRSRGLYGWTEADDGLKRMWLR